MPEENDVVQSVGNWPRVSGSNDGVELEWVELRPGVMVLRRRPVAIKMRAPLANKMRRRSMNKNG